jgi:hypothetical protein
MIRLRKWRSRRRGLRSIRLYKSWLNLKGRLSGSNVAGNGSRLWMGLSNDFEDFEHFRNWALANGFSKVHCSLDRINPNRGYGPTNCQWLTVSENSAKVHTDREWLPDDDMVMVTTVWSEENHARECPF